MVKQTNKRKATVKSTSAQIKKKKVAAKSTSTTAKKRRASTDSAPVKRPRIDDQPFFTARLKPEVVQLFTDEPGLSIVDAALRINPYLTKEDIRKITTYVDGHFEGKRDQKTLLDKFDDNNFGKYADDKKTSIASSPDKRNPATAAWNTVRKTFYDIRLPPEVSSQINEEHMNRAHDFIEYLHEDIGHFDKEPEAQLIATKIENMRQDPRYKSSNPHRGVLLKLERWVNPSGLSVEIVQNIMIANPDPDDPSKITPALRPGIKALLEGDKEKGRPEPQKLSSLMEMLLAVEGKADPGFIANVRIHVDAYIDSQVIQKGERIADAFKDIVSFGDHREKFSLTDASKGSQGVATWNAIEKLFYKSILLERLKDQNWWVNQSTAKTLFSATDLFRTEELALRQEINPADILSNAQTCAKMIIEAIKDEDRWSGFKGLLLDLRENQHPDLLDEWCKSALDDITKDINSAITQNHMRNDARLLVTYLQAEGLCDKFKTNPSLCVSQINEEFEGNEAFLKTFKRLLPYLEDSAIIAAQETQQTQQTQQPSTNDEMDTSWTSNHVIPSSSKTQPSKIAEHLRPRFDNWDALKKAYDDNAAKTINVFLNDENKMVDAFIAYAKTAGISPSQTPQALVTQVQAWSQKSENTGMQKGGLNSLLRAQYSSYAFWVDEGITKRHLTQDQKKEVQELRKHVTSDRKYEVEAVYHTMLEHMNSEQPLQAFRNLPDTQKETTAAKIREAHSQSLEFIQRDSNSQRKQQDALDRVINFIVHGEIDNSMSTSERNTVSLKLETTDWRSVPLTADTSVDGGLLALTKDGDAIKSAVFRVNKDSNTRPIEVVKLDAKQLPPHVKNDLEKNNINKNFEFSPVQTGLKKTSVTKTTKIY